MFNELDRTIPETAETAPKIALSMKYRDKFALMMRAAAAGVTTRKPTSNVPVTCMPIATVTDTRRRYIRFTRAVLIPLDVASSSEIKLKTIFL